ncbi:hypothetical protein NDA13_002139 [Ustilago tritici]|nr:hypothetical protein NDA13_002139 [Ustilago tritici]
MYKSDNHHHVVNIGGAQFVPPMMTHFAQVPHLNLSISPSSEASSSTVSSPVHSRFSSSSSSASSAAESLEGWDPVQAHLAYAKRMADHTAGMWQKERLAIEKAKLEGTYTGNVTSRQNGNARPPADKHAASSASSSSASSSSASTKSPTSSDKKSRRLASIFSLFSPSESEAPRGRSRRRS